MSGSIKAGEIPKGPLPTEGKEGSEQLPEVSVGTDVRAVELPVGCIDSSWVAVLGTYHPCYGGLSGDTAAFESFLLFVSDPFPTVLLGTPAKTHWFTEVDIGAIVPSVCPSLPFWGEQVRVWCLPMKKSVTQWLDKHTLSTELQL